MVRAIDAQQSIIQMHPAEKVQQIQQQHGDMQQRYFQMQLSEEDRILREKIKQSEEAEKTIIREKEEQKDKRQGKDKQNKETAGLICAEEAESADEGGHINIKV
jgi:hypothetical protein